MNTGIRVAAPPAKRTLIYDGDCRFCTVWVRRWQQTTGDTVDYVPQQSAEVGARFPELRPEQLARAVHLIEPDGSVFSGAEAVFRSLRGQVDWPLGFYEALPGFDTVSEFIYSLVERNRTLFSWLTRLLWGTSVERPEYIRVRWLFLRGLGIVYLIAFASLWTQILGLIGQRGILPAGDYLRAVEQGSGTLGWGRAWVVPTFCWFSSSDAMLVGHCVGGVVLAMLLVCDVAPALCAFGLWLLYLSLANVSGLFLGYQWDGLLLEAGLLAVLLAPWKWLPGMKRDPPLPRVMIFLLRWLVFRLLFSSGVEKLTSGDPLWRNLTALTFHYETQPLPTWLAWYAHHLPLWFHKASCVAMFGIELVVPFLVFLPRRPRLVAFWCFTGFMLLISATGNYTFFNLLTVVLCVALLDDQTLRNLWPLNRRRPGETTDLVAAERIRLFASAVSRLRVFKVQRIASISLAVVVLIVSTILLCAMLRLPIPWGSPFTTLYGLAAPWRSINSYGLFAVMTTPRFEIVIEGSADGQTWREYEFKWKPGDPQRRPGFVAPHQPRLDWQMWFAALGDLRSNLWLLNLSDRLLRGEPGVLALLSRNPFPDAPPRYVRAVRYVYRFSDSDALRTQHIWWQRELRDIYLPPVTLAMLRGSN